MKSPRIIAASIALALTLALSACGSSAYSPLKQADLAQSISKAAMRMQSVHMSIRASRALAIAADFIYSKPTAMQMTMAITESNATSVVKLRILGDAIYLQLPPVTPAGKWVKTSTAALGGSGAQSYAGLSPQGIADQFKKGLKSLKYVGSAKVGGQEVRHYTLVEDASQLGPTLKSLASQVPSLAGVTMITEQVYLNDDNLLQRMTVALPAPIGTMEIDFTKWNVPVSIVAPAAASVLAPKS